MAIVFDNLNFAAGEEIVITGMVDDDTVTTVNYGGTDYPLTDSTFSFNLGVQDPGTYEFAITLVDGTTPGEVITENIVVASEESTESTESTELAELTEDELLDMAKANDPTPDFIADYVPFVVSDTDNIVVEAGSVTGFWPIETTEQKFPTRRNIDTTHPNPEVNGADGMFNGHGRQADLVDEDSNSERLVTRKAEGSAIATTGFTL